MKWSNMSELSAPNFDQYLYCIYAVIMKAPRLWNTPKSLPGFEPSRGPKTRLTQHDCRIWI